MDLAPSGRQLQISRGGQRATIVEVGAGIREYTVGERPVLEPYPLEAMCDGAHGAPLLPWPNRVADGRYSFDGVEHQLDLSEAARGNAIHGLSRWRSWSRAEQEPERVLMRTRLHPLPGYPFTLDLAIAYELGADGLRVSTTASNLGDRPCPYGAGQHPYLSPGNGLVDEGTLELAAGVRLLNDERMIPVGREPVAGTPYDFRTPRRIGQQAMDVALGDLRREQDGRAITRFTGADGHCVELWVDEHHSFLELFTGDTLAPARRRRGLAVEPMTCVPNAFQSGEGLLRLAPGEAITTRWGVALVPGGGGASPAPRG